MNNTGKTIALIIVVLVALGGAALAYHYVGGNTNVAEAPALTDANNLGAYQSGTSAPVTTANPPASTTSQPVSNPPMIHVPHIDSIQPSSGPAGTSVTLTGSGFNSTSQILISSGAYGRTTVNAAGTILTFTASDSAGAYCHKNQACPMYALLLKPGVYSISVGNDDGTKSNSVQFTLTGTATNKSI